MTTMRTSALVAIAALFLTAATCADEPAEGLRFDFDDGDLGGFSEPTFYSATSGADPGGASWQVEDGALTVRCDFAPDNLQRASDRVEMTLGDAGMASLTDYPVLEIRLRMSNRVGDLCVICTYAYADGSRQSPYFYADYGGRENEWVTVVTRLVGDSSAPKRWTPRKLVDISIRFRCEGPLTGDIDWIRLRGLDDTERIREGQWTDLLADYQPVESQKLKDFFPFGVYDAPPDSSSTHKITHRMAYRMLSKHHLNFVKASGGNVKAAEETGMSLGVRLRAAGHHFEEGGPRAVIDWAKPIIDSVKASPAVICYDVGDECPIARLWGITGGISVISQLDPTRNCVLTFWDPSAIRAYGPYVAVDVADIYPLVDSGTKGAACLYDWCRRVARENDNKRQWMILQSFGAAPWRGRRGYIVPTVEQLRLQVYAALAGGARGIIMYSTSYDRYRMLTDQWANPNELMQEAARLGAALIPIGRRLLDCTVDFEASASCDNENIIVGIVQAPRRDARYVILANKDETSVQGGRLLRPGGLLFDLTSLEQVADGTIEPLQPGGGRIYMVGRPEQFEREAAIILRNRADEQRRATTPDRLFESLGCSRKHADELDEAARIMGAIEPAMYFDNPDAKVVELMTGHRDRYWGIHAQWVMTYDAVLRGEKLPDQHSYDVLRHSRTLVRQVKEVLGDHPMYPGGHGE